MIHIGCLECFCFSQVNKKDYRCTLDSLYKLFWCYYFYLFWCYLLFLCITIEVKKGEIGKMFFEAEVGCVFSKRD